MLEALYRKKQDVMESIDYFNREIERAKADAEYCKVRLAVIEEMIAEELEKQPNTIIEDPIKEAPVDEVSLDSDEIVVIR